MLLFALGLMTLATAAARIPLKEILQGICHMYEERCCISQRRLWSVVSVHGFAKNLLKGTSTPTKASL